MPLDQALVGSVVTGALAIASQCVSKLRCYTSCRRGEDGEYCEPQFFCGFMDSTLIETAEGLASHTVRAEQESPE
jgi:hypothetical protein